ncbi:MAG: hypothetical protein QXL15_04760 [Candidatus Korarchaeota archaeon]
MGKIPLRVFCQKCNNNLNIELETSIVENAPYLPVPYAYVHGEPLHILIIYLDRDFKVRGTDLSEYVSIQAPPVETIQFTLKSFISFLGEYKFALLIGGLITKKNVFVAGPKDIVSSVQRIIASLKLVESEKSIATSPDKNTVLLDMHDGKLEHVPPLLSRFPLYLARRLATMEPAAAEAFLRSVMESLWQSVRILSQQNGLVSYSQARKLLGLNSDEQEMLPYIIEAGNLQNKVVTDAEFSLRKGLW